MQTRRHVLLGMGAVTAGSVAGCSGGSGLSNAAQVDNNVNRAIAMMHERLPFTQDVQSRALGMLVMPGIVKGGFIVGASYGEGALRLPQDGYARSASYYSFGAGSVGLQAGLQKTAHALFFMTPDSLARFQRSKGFEAGVDTEVTVLDTGIKADVNTTAAQQPVLAVVFNQAGLAAGASLQGAKYTQIQI